MKLKSTLLFINLSVILFTGALMIPFVCALSSVEDSVRIFSSLVEEEEGETHDVKKDTEVKIASAIGYNQDSESSIQSKTIFGYFRFGTAPYLKIVIPPPDQA